MSKIWAGMLIAGVFFAGLKGNWGDINDILMHSSESAIMFVLGFAGIMAVWSGLLKVAEDAGLIRLLAEKRRRIRQRVIKQ